MRSLCVALVLAACVPPDEVVAGGEPLGDLAIYRIERGDCLSVIADQLGYRGGWRALARANGIRGDRIIAGRALVVPVDHLTRDPYGELGLERYDPPLPSEPLVACVTEHARGSCVTLGDSTVCVEAVALPDGDPDEPDGRELALYRNTERRVVAALPSESELVIEAHRVDLAGDHRSELVVAVPQQTRNHLAFEHARVFVIDGELVTQLEVAQWGTGSIIENRERGCDLLATSWDDFEPPLEGSGLYFIGRRLEYTHGALTPSGEIVARRFRTYFHTEGLSDDDYASGFPPSKPAEWLSTDAKWWHDPAPRFGDTELHANDASGVIERVDTLPDGVALVIARDDGDHVTIASDVQPSDEQHDRWSLEAIAWGPDGGVFPTAYIPGDRSRWVGTHVVIDRLSDDSDHPCDPSFGCPYRGYVVWLAR